MKKDTSTADSKTSKTRTGKATASKVTPKTTKKSVSPEVVQTKAESAVKEETNTKAEASIEKATEKAPEPVKAAKTATNKSSAKPKVAEQEVVEEKSSATSAEISVRERVGLTAGDIWNHLTENGPTPVSKLMAALPEKDAIIQRSIGWLARENKVVLSVVDRIETIALED